MEFKGDKFIKVGTFDYYSAEYVEWLEDQLAAAQPRDYGFSRDLKEDDERQLKFLQQRLERGFDDTETWGLNATITKFILPRLKVFKELNNGFPGDLTFKKWTNIIQKMIDGFEEYLKRDNVGSDSWDYKKVKRGLKLFTKYYHDLWW